MNSRTSFYISVIFMISCSFLATVENFLVTVGLKTSGKNVFSGWNKTSLIRELFTRCTEEFLNIVCIWVSTLTPKKHPLPLFAKPPLDLRTVQAPLFRQFSSIYWFFVTPPPPDQVFLRTPMMIKFFILSPIPSFKYLRF